VVESYVHWLGALHPGEELVVELVESIQQRCPLSPQAVHRYWVLPVVGDVLARQRLPAAPQ
jgi:hypothetical protein